MWIERSLVLGNRDCPLLLWIDWLKFMRKCGWKEAWFTKRQTANYTTRYVKCFEKVWMESSLAQESRDDLLRKCGRNEKGDSDS